jgi:hypothetical protein
MDPALRWFYIGCLAVCFACAVALISAPTVHRSREADHASGGHASVPLSAQSEEAPALRPLASVATFTLEEEQGDNGLGYSMEYDGGAGGMLAVSESRSVPGGGRVLVLRMELDEASGTQRLVRAGAAQVAVENNLFGRAVAWSPEARRLAVSASGGADGDGRVYVYTVDEKGRVLQDTRQELAQVKGREGSTGSSGVGWMRGGATLLTGEGQYTDQWYANPRNEHVQWRDEFDAFTGQQASLLATAGGGGVAVLARGSTLRVYRETDDVLAFAGQAEAAGRVTGVRLFDDGSGGVVATQVGEDEFALQALSVAPDGTVEVAALAQSSPPLDNSVSATITWNDGVPRFPRADGELEARRVCCTRTGAYVFVGVPERRVVSVFRRVADRQYAKVASLPDPAEAPGRFGSAVACSADEVGDVRLFVGDDASNKVYLYQTA